MTSIKRTTYDVSGKHSRDFVAEALIREHVSKAVATRYPQCRTKLVHSAPVNKPIAVAISSRT